MGLDFGTRLFPGANYLEGEEGYRAAVDIDGNLNVSGAVSFPAAQSVFFDTAQQVTFSGAQYVAFATAQDVTFPSAQSVLFDTAQNVYSVQSGAYIITGPVTQSGAWIITGTTNVDVQNSVIEMNISGATIENNTLLSDWKWLIDHGTFSGATGVATNATTTLFTCPAGKVAYVNSAQMTVDGLSDSASSNVYYLINGTTIMRQVSTLDLNHTESLAISFAIPVQVASGATVQIQSAGVAASIRGGWSGYILDA